MVTAREQFLAQVRTPDLDAEVHELRLSLTDLEPVEAMRRLVLFIVLLTFAVEGVGAALFYFGWPQTWPGAPLMESAGDRLFHSVFFAVSAYCNAGFTTSTNSLAGLGLHWTSHLVVGALVTIGGLGFPVFENFREIVWARLRGVRKVSSGLVRLNLHTKLVLTTTLLVYLTGLAIVFVGALLHTGNPALVDLLNAHFMSISSRTAGFQTLPPAEMDPMGQFAMMIFMFIGGSPGSTAGGVKTIVIAVLVMTVWATVAGRSETQAFGRAIAQEIPIWDPDICIDCGKVVEFEDDNTAVLIDCITRRLGFRPSSKSMRIEACCDRLRSDGFCENLIQMRLVKR